MSRYDVLLARAEELYRDVVVSPEDWPPERVAEWADDAVADGEGFDRETAKLLRRVVRAAVRLGAFWGSGQEGLPDDHGDWRTRVDIAAGNRAWRPVLDLARHGLDVDPSPDLFASVKELFAVVTSQRWMEGVEYSEWLEGIFRDR